MANSPVPPFMAAPTATAPNAPVAETATAPEVKKDRKERSQVTITKDHISFIVKNVKTMSYGEMADKLGLSTHQVNRVLMELKQGLRKSAIDENANAYGKNEKGNYDYSAPLTDKAKSVEAKIDTALSRPAESRPGGQKGTGQVRNALDSEIANILAGL